MGNNLQQEIVSCFGISYREARRTIELMAKYPEFKKTTFKILLKERKQRR